MSLDMKKMRQKLQAVQNKGGGKSIFWRPTDGEHVIRIIPTTDGDPFKDYWFHYNLGDNPGFLSPKKNFGEDCPLDSYVRELYKQGDEESIKMAKSLNARQRFFSPVLVRGEEKSGVRIWGYGKMAYQELLNLVLNPEYGDITDAEGGTDLLIKYGKPPGAQFPQTTITPRRKTSPISEDGEQAKEFLESVPEFESVFDRKTPSQVQEMLDEFISSQLSEDEVEELSEEQTKYTSSSSDVIDKKFDEMLTA